MAHKAEILLHPVRMKIIRTLLVHHEEGLSPLEIAKEIKDVSQATLYRHLQKLADAEIIQVSKRKKVRAVTESYYTVNKQEVRVSLEEWDTYTKEEKLYYFSFYQLFLFNQYQIYLEALASENVDDSSTLAIIDLKLDDHMLESFQQDLHTLLMKYYEQSKGNPKNETRTRTIGMTIIP